MPPKRSPKKSARKSKTVKVSSIADTQIKRLATATGNERVSMDVYYTVRTALSDHMDKIISKIVTLKQRLHKQTVDAKIVEDVINERRLRSRIVSVIPQTTFKRMVKQWLAMHESKSRVTDEANQKLQRYAENFLNELFEKAGSIRIYKRRKTLYEEDVIQALEAIK
jgi:histone H3/H4